MGKKKSKGGVGKKPKSADVYEESNEFYDGLEHDAADQFEANQDARIKSKMEKIHTRNKSRDVSGGYEELYALSGDSDDDEDMENEGIEFADGDDDEEADVRAWGNKKKHFYGGNPNETKQRFDPQNDELDEAEAEEAEGKLLQQKQLQGMDDEDFFDMFTPDVDKGRQKESLDSDAVKFDINQLSKKERVALFQKESPEFQGILGDFEEKMKEVIELWQPVVDLCNDGKIPANGAAMDYVNTKYKLTLT